MKKVLIFSLSYFPKHVGGAEVAIKEKTDRMPDIEFHLVCLRYDSLLPKDEQIGNVHVHRIGFSRPDPSMAELRRFPLHLNRYLYQFTAAFYALALHKRLRFDATWAMMAHSCGVPAAVFKLFRPRIPFVLELQEGDPPAHIERLARPVWPLFSRAFTSADAVSVISTFLGAWAQRRGFAGSVVLVPNGVDTSNFAREQASEDIAAVRERLGRKQGDVLLITTSRLVHKNALDDVISALPLLPERVSFAILGIGPDEEMLRSLATRLGVSDRVRFVGQVGHADMPTYLKAADIFIRPSRSEGMGNSFIEAMAAGVPVIATQEGGIADFLFDERVNPGVPMTGWAVPKDSPAAIAEAVQRITSDPEHVRSVVQTARRMAAEKYDWDTIAHHMHDDVFLPLLQQSSCVKGL